MRVRLRPQHAAEAARIVEAQHLPSIQKNIPMIVHPRRHRGGQHPQTSRHAEMQNQGARIERDQNVLGAPRDAAHRLMAYRLLEICRDRPAQPSFTHDHVDDAPFEQAGRDAAAGGFYFRELGQELLDLRFFVGDVLAHDRIEFLRFHFVRMQTLVLRGRVVVSGAGG